MKNIRSSYKNYREKSDSPVSEKEYCKIVNKFNKFIMANILSGEEIRIPAKMGTISVKGKKTKISYDEQGFVRGLSVDQKATMELWGRCQECKEKKQLVYHLNEHTGGVRYKYFWSKDRVLVTNKTFYNMIFTRTNKRLLSQLIQQGREYYIEPDKY